MFYAFVNGDGTVAKSLVGKSIYAAVGQDSPIVSRGLACGVPGQGDRAVRHSLPSQGHRPWGPLHRVRHRHPLGHRVGRGRAAARTRRLTGRKRPPGPSQCR